MRTHAYAHLRNPSNVPVETESFFNSFAIFTEGAQLFRLCILVIESDYMAFTVDGPTYQTSVCFDIRMWHPNEYKIKKRNPQSPPPPPRRRLPFRYPFSFHPLSACIFIYYMVHVSHSFAFAECFSQT